MLCSFTPQEKTLLNLAHCAGVRGLSCTRAICALPSESPKLSSLPPIKACIRAEQPDFCNRLKHMQCFTGVSDGDSDLPLNGLCYHSWTVGAKYLLSWNRGCRSTLGIVTPAPDTLGKQQSSVEKTCRRNRRGATSPASPLRFHTHRLHYTGTRTRHSNT